METRIKEEIWERLLYHDSFWSNGFTIDNLEKIKDHVFDEELIWTKISILIPEYIGEFRDLEEADYYTYSIIYTLLCETISEKLTLCKLLDFN